MSLCCTNLQAEDVGDVGHGQRDAQTGLIGLMQPLGEHLNAEKLVQPLQTFHVEGHEEHHACLVAPQWRLHDLHHIFHILMKMVQTWWKGRRKKKRGTGGFCEMRGKGKSLSELQTLFFEEQLSARACSHSAFGCTPLQLLNVKWATTGRHHNRFGQKSKYSKCNLGIEMDFWHKGMHK